ncbi:MAG TPA: hypothetical protein VFT19_02220 [Solirubrobacterales bacterium]|nr:hypothetical protein [Solirubrobacterales bacterium]
MRLGEPTLPADALVPNAHSARTEKWLNIRPQEAKATGRARLIADIDISPRIVDS